MLKLYSTLHRDGERLQTFTGRKRYFVLYLCHFCYFYWTNSIFTSHDYFYWNDSIFTSHDYFYWTDSIFSSHDYLY